MSGRFFHIQFINLNNFDDFEYNKNKNNWRELMQNIEEYLKNIDTNDKNILYAKNRLTKIMLDPQFRRNVVGEIEDKINELEKIDWTDGEESFTFTIRGINLMRLKVIFIFFSNVLGIPEEDVLSYLVQPGIEQEIYKLGLVRQAIAENTGKAISKAQDLSINYDDLIK